MDNYKIFSYLAKDGNNQLNNLSFNGKLELFNYINQYYLELRKSLNISDKESFGFEMEAECFRYDKIYKLMLDNGFDLSKWIIKPDASLYKGFEVVTPVLNKDNIDWNKIRLLCDIIKNNSKIGMHAASHIHIGAQMLGNNRENIKRFIMLWSAYQHIIFRFGYGEFLNERPRMIKYAILNGNSWFKMLNVIENFSELSNMKIINWMSYKNQAINLTNVTSLDKIDKKNTIEFRFFNYTLNAVIWQNNYNLVKHVLDYCNNDNYNYDIIKKRIEISKDKLDNLNYYRKLDIDSVLEFVDLIFTKNIDKIYFLRQYLKNMEETDSNYLTFAKKYTK